MDKKFLIILTLHIIGHIYCKEECQWKETHTFETKDESKFTFSADIKEGKGLVIDILYGDGYNDRIKIYPKEISTFKLNDEKKKHIKTKINSSLTEGWQDICVTVDTRTLNVSFTSSKVDPVIFSLQSRIRSIKVDAAIQLKICEESCNIEKIIKRSINNEDGFNITVFTTSKYPITCQINSPEDSGVIRHLEIKPNNCNYKWQQRNIKIDYINHGWNKLNILVNKTTFAINNNVIPVDVALKTIAISGNYLVNCTKGTPIWKISTDEISIPISSGQEIIFVLSSVVEFSPVFNLDGNRVMLHWNNGLSSYGKPLQPNSYQIIFEATSQILRLYNEDKTDVLMDLKIEKAPEFIRVSSMKGEYQLSLTVGDQLKQQHKEHITGPSANTGSYRKEASSGPALSSCTVWQITAALSSLIAATLLIVLIYIKWPRIHNKNIEIYDEEETIPLLQVSPKNKIKSDYTEKHGEFNSQFSSYQKEICKLNLESDPNNKHKNILGQLEPSKQTKVILTVGETGSGKSSVINGIINYIYGITFDDSFRFELSGINTTKEITSYYIPCTPGIVNDSNYVFIDTPGLGDLRGIGELITKFYNFLKKSQDIAEVDAICFVIKASDTRLNKIQKYIIESLFSMFGKDVKRNIYVFVSFSDGSVTHVPKLLKDSGLEYELDIHFNGDGLFNDSSNMEIGTETDMHEHFYEKWKMNTDYMDLFFSALKKKTPVSLVLTNMVLEETKDFEKLTNELLKLDTKEEKNEQNQSLLMIKLDEAKKLYGRLKEIPCKENPLTLNDNIDYLIKSEKDENKITKLEKLKECNNIFQNLLKKWKKMD